MRGAVPDVERYEEQAKKLRGAQQRIKEQKERLESKKRENHQLKNILRAAKKQDDLESDLIRGEAPSVERYKEQAENLRNARQLLKEQKSMLKSKDREIFRLKNELRTAKELAKRASGVQPSLQVADELEIGALPDFIIIGGQRCGTSFCYRRLLSWHPYIEPAAMKEVHYFDLHFDKDVDWYRSNFPLLAWKEGQRVITGEASPDYLFHPHAARRAAAVVPQAQLIVLLRNPVDRAYSAYYLQRRQEYELLPSFEEAIEAEDDRIRGEMEKMIADESYNSYNSQHFSYLSRGIYVDQLREWHKFFDEDQILILKSEDLYDRTADTSKIIQSFLHLPAWQPKLSILSKSQNEHPQMSPATRRWLEDYFEPHNQRLYEYLGVDFGW
jgi:hypothetical protein